MNSTAFSLFRKLELTRSLSDEQLQKLVAKSRSKTFKAGEILIQQGVPQEEAFLLETGKMNRYLDGELIEHVTPGLITGFLHIFQKEPAFATLKAEVDCKVWILTTADLDDLLTDPKISKALMSGLSYLSRQQLKAVRKLEQLTFGKKKEFRIAFFDAKRFWEKPFHDQMHTLKLDYEIKYLPQKLTEDSVKTAEGFHAVCVFVNDQINAKVIRALKEAGVDLILLRCAGYNNVDLKETKKLGMTVARVPAYSPYAVAEYALALLLSVNRKIYRAHQRVRDGNFSLDGLVGFDIHGKTIGIIGTGKIGRCTVDIFKGMGCNILCYDLYPSKELQNVERVKYVTLDELAKNSDVISLHCPLTADNKHMINDDFISKTKKGVVLINTSRGGLLDANALIRGIESGHIVGAGLDVYENEGEYFFEDHSDQVIKDNAFSRLIQFNNVVVTGHQAFLTKEALDKIAETTLLNAKSFKEGLTQEKHPNHCIEEY